MPKKNCSSASKQPWWKGIPTPLRLALLVSLQWECSCSFSRGNTRVCALEKGFRIKELTVYSLGSTEFFGDLLHWEPEKRISDSIQEQFSGLWTKSSEASILMYAQLSRPLKWLFHFSNFRVFIAASSCSNWLSIEKRSCTNKYQAMGEFSNKDNNKNISPFSSLWLNNP